ncbi:MAG: YedE-related selenium metabolism membrane protein [Lachnospiraceae bacterium]|nr:YedE-related selenium metabolism membrane protein [Lachnospiraceae bacterium]
MLKGKCNLVVFGILAGIVAVILAVMGNPGNMAICVACFVRDIAGAAYLHTAPVVQYMRPEIIGIVVGAFIISLITKEHRSTAGSSPMIRFVLGFVTMIGALMFLGCPLRMIIRMSAGDVNAYIALIGFAGGIATGAFFLKKGFSLGRAYDSKPADGVVLPVILVILFLLSITTTLFAASTEGPGSMHAPILVSLIGGIVFGIAAQRSRMCFAGGIRDTILMKDATLLIPIGVLFVVMLIYNIVGGNFHFSMAGQPIAHTEVLWNILGMYIVGLAACLAGGCPLRQLILAGSGSADSAISVVGMLLGAGFAHNFKLASSADGSTPAGRIAVVASIVILFIIALVNIRRNKA